MTQHEPHGATPAEPTPPASGEPTAHAPQSPAPAPVPAPHPTDGGQYGQGHQHTGGPQYLGAHQGAGPMSVAAKSPALAALASFFITGLGQLINGQGMRALVIFGTQVAMVMVSILLTFILLGWIMWLPITIFQLWQVYDAYKGAQNWNAQHGIIS